MKPSGPLETETGLGAVHPVALTCWKDVARYMGKGVRTVQRWEREYGLPVRRPVGVTSKSCIMAHTDDLDAWLRDGWCDRMSRRNGSAVVRCKDSLRGASLTNQIRTSHELRAANHALVREISSVLRALVENCDQLMANKLEFGRPLEGQLLDMEVMEFKADPLAERALT